MPRMNSLIRELVTVFSICAVLCICSGTTSFAAVVLTGSMEPELNVGDVILSYGSFINSLDPKVGDIILYKLANSTMQIPIVHRVIETHVKDSKTVLLPKGDANNVDDRSIWRMYTTGHKQWLESDEVMSVVYGKIPYIGMPIVWLNRLFGGGIWRWIIAVVCIIIEFRSAVVLK